MEIVELPEFTKSWKVLGLDDNVENLKALQLEILQQPNSAKALGSELYKIRFQLPGKGKRGGVRIIYADFRKHGAIFFLVVFSKGDFENLTVSQQKIVFGLARKLKAKLLGIELKGEEK